MRGSRTYEACARLLLIASTGWVITLTACGEDESTPGLGGHETTQGGAEDVAARPVATPAPAPTAKGTGAPEFAEEAYKRWAVLVAANLVDEARGLCTTWLEDPDPGLRVEAHKCLANVEITEGRLPDAHDINSQATAYQPRFRAGAVDRAVEHYEAAIAISPLERQAHQGRMDVLIIGGRYRDANIALDETLRAFQSREQLPAWFKLLGRLRQLGRYEEALDYLQVIEKHHPLDHRVVANLAAYHAMLGHYDEALEYSQRSVLLDPDDPINQWNLARLYDSNGDLDKADATYLEALALFRNSDPRARCDYVDFLENRMNDNARACAYAETGCVERFEEFCKTDPAAQEEG